MKLIIAMAALGLAMPAAAQTAPARSEHHGQHHQGPQPAGQGHQGHGSGDHKDCCCKDRPEGQKMACCKKHGDKAKADAQPSGEHAH